MPAQEPLQKRNTVAAQDQPAGDDALFANTEVPVALIGTSYSANPNWNFVGALKEALRSDVVNYAEDGHGPILPMLTYLKKRCFQEQPATSADLGVP